jgi:hypothetical protein
MDLNSIWALNYHWIWALTGLWLSLSFELLPGFGSLWDVVLNIFEAQYGFGI